MSADLSLKIVADPSAAKEGLQAIQDELGKLNTSMQKVMKTSAKSFRPFNVEDMDKATDEIKKFKIHLNAVAHGTNALVSQLDKPEDKIKAWNKQLSYLKKEYSEFLSQGKFSFEGKDMLGNFMLSNIKTTEEAINSLKTAINKEKELQKAAKQSAEAEQLELLGTKYDKVTAKLNEHRKALQALLVEKHKQKTVTADLQKKIDAEVVSIKKLTKEQEKASKTSFLSKMLSIAKNIMGFQMAIMLFRKTMTNIVNLFKDASREAAVAEQTFNKLGTVFEGYASAEARVRSLGNAIGVASSTAANALSTVGDLLQAQGMGIGESLMVAKEWVSQFQDIIAFKDLNISLEEFAQNFMSGAAGNLRNFRTFGSIVKESAVQAELARRNLDKLSGSQLELAKMTIRAEMALEQQKNSVGAVAREWESMESVNRRYNEAWKQFRENIGEKINEPLKDIKSWWTEILNEINRTNSALMMYKELTGEATPPTTRSNDKNAWQKFLSFFTGTGNFSKTQESFYSSVSDIVNGGNFIPTETNYQAMAKIGMDLYGLTVQETAEVLKRFNMTMTDTVKIVEDAKKSMNEISEKDKEKAALESAQIKSDAYFESILALTGAGDLSLWNEKYKSLANYNFMSQANFSDGARAATGNIAKTDLSAFGNQTLVGLGGDWQQDAYRARIKAQEDLYSLAYNQFLLDGKISKQEGETLDRIRKNWSEATVSLEAYNDELKRQTDYAKELENIQKATQGHKDNTATLGFTDLGKALYSLDSSRAESLKLAKGDNEIAEINALYDEQKDAIYNYYSALSLLTDKTEEEAQAEEARAAISEAQAEAQKALIEAMGDLRSTIKNDFTSIFGKAGTLANSIKNFAQNHDMNDTEGIQNAKDLWSAIFAILKETEVFQKVLEGVDTALSAVDSILAPFIPYIDMINRQAQQLMEVLQPLIPVIKVVSSVLTIMQASLMSVFVAIKGVVQTVLGSIMSFVYDIANGIVDIFQGIGWGKVKVFGKTILHSFNLADALGMHNFSKPAWVSDWADGFDLGSAEEEIWDEMNDTLYKIWNTSEKIAFNTSEDNSKILEELNYLYAHGIIDANTYNARVNSTTGGNYLDTVSSNGIWNNGFAAGRVTNNVNVTINGSGLSKDELESALTNALTKITGNSVYVQTQAASFA